MNSQRNIRAAQNMYTAFGKGDVPAILEHVDADVEWDTTWVQGTYDIPWLEPRRGRQSVVEFFKVVAAHLDFQVFNPKNILSGGDQVVGLVEIEAKVKTTGKLVKDLEAHIFTFNEVGQVIGFRHLLDTFGHLKGLGKVYSETKN